MVRLIFVFLYLNPQPGVCAFLALLVICVFIYIGDSFSYHKGQQFSTPDSDNDRLDDTECAVKYRGLYAKSFVCQLPD